MAAFTIYDESKHWRVIAVPSTTVGAELYKAMAAAEQQYQEVYGRANEWDSTFEVLADEEQIRIRFELKEKS
jgi:hypothetical protein